MKIALEAVGFYERDIEYNRNKIFIQRRENGEIEALCRKT